MCGKTNQQGRQPAWLNPELLLGLRKKRGVYYFWKKGQAIPEGYRDLVRSCREKIRKAKLQLELNLATIERDNKSCFYKYINNNKKRAKEKLHSFLDAGENIAATDEEKAKVFSAFFASVSYSQTSYSQDIQHPVLEDRDREQNKPPIIQYEAFNNPATPPRHSQVYGAGWDPPKSTKGAGGGSCQASLHHGPAVLVNKQLGSPR